MKCSMQQIGTKGERRTYRCRRCPMELSSPYPPENINSPCKGWPIWWELGYWVEFCLAVFGINEARFNWLRFRLGFTTTTGCGCGQRIEVLNASGGWLADRLAVLGVLWRWIARITRARQS